MNVFWVYWGQGFVVLFLVVQWVFGGEVLWEVVGEVVCGRWVVVCLFQGKVVLGVGFGGNGLFEVLEYVVEYCQVVEQQQEGVYGVGEVQFGLGLVVGGVGVVVLGYFQQIQDVLWQEGQL